MLTQFFVAGMLRSWHSAYSRCRLQPALLLKCIPHLEHRQVHGNHDHPDQEAHHDDKKGLHDTAQLSVVFRCSNVSDFERLCL